MRSPFEMIQLLRRQHASPSQIWTLLQVRHALKDCRSVLDIGCGPDSPLAAFGIEQLVGYEGYEPSLQAAAKKQTHHKLVLGKVQELAQHFRARELDACVALDVIEHLPKAEGWQMLQAMERIAARKCVILTPNGFLPQGHSERADLQEHLSGWEPAEMQQHGYAVSGVLGPKWLRGEYHKLTRQPEWFWGGVSVLGQIAFAQWVPSQAAAILCVKRPHQ